VASAGTSNTMSHYVHGTAPDEQDRLERLNRWVNDRCVAAMGLKEGDRVVDFGSGLGGLTERMSATVGPLGRVLGIERSERQIAVARARGNAGVSTPKPEYRAGAVEEPPLAPDEWGAFDVAHARFVLEHVQHPLAVVRNMVRSVRRTGRVILADDDHSLMCLWPQCPGVDAASTAYRRAFERNGNDSVVGRRLVQLLHQAGAQPMRNDWLFFGSCSGSSDWPTAVENFRGVLRSAADQMIERELIDKDSLEFALESVELWQRRPDAAIWNAIAWAEGVRRD
jgi:ubiquinone/menaquinone biosynthesis C-methylase UbiE